MSRENSICVAAGGGSLGASAAKANSAPNEIIMANGNDGARRSVTDVICWLHEFLALIASLLPFAEAPIKSI